MYMYTSIYIYTLKTTVPGLSYSIPSVATGHSQDIVELHKSQALPALPALLVEVFFHLL